MFEKEARKWVKEHTEIDYKASYGEFPIEPSAIKSFKAGATFGYNKANEWHYVKDELPELYKDVLVFFPQGDCEVKYLTKHNEWVGRGSWCSLADVIAWKEIVLPKEIKENG